jgi:hypothetical protein
MGSWSLPLFESVKMKTPSILADTDAVSRTDAVLGEPTTAERPIRIFAGPRSRTARQARIFFTPRCGRGQRY